MNAASLRVGRLTLCCLGAVAALACEPEPTVRGPSVPQVAPVDSPTNQRSVTLRGTKESATALIIDGKERLALSDNVTFAIDVELEEGGNVILVAVEDAAGRRSGDARIVITVDTTAPGAPTLDALLPRTVREEVTISGTKPVDAALYLNGQEQAGVSASASFSVPLALVVGENAMRISAMDALDNESDVVAGSIERFDQLPFSLDAPPTIVTTSSVTLTGSRGPGVTVSIDGVALAADADGGNWSSDVSLAVGENSLVVGAHFDGEPSEIEEQTLTVHYHPIPDAPVLDPAPARAGAIVTITGTKPANTAIERDGVEVVALGPETTFSDDVTLSAEGQNTLSYVAVSEFDQRSSAAAVDVIRDTTAPSLALDPALAGSLVGDLLDVAGAASDADPSLVVELCVGACALDSDFSAVTVSSGVFADVLDLSARADLVDGAFATVHARATDSLLLRTEASADVLLSRAAVATGEAAGTSLALASTGDPFVVAWAALESGAVVLTQDLAPPVGGFSSTTLSDAGALALGAPRIAMGASGAGWVTFAEASTRTASVDTTRGVLALSFDDGGADAPLLVTDASAGDAVAVDVTLLSTGEAAVATVVGDVVSVSISNGASFDPAVVVSDATTAGVTDVRLVADENDALIVAWLETSARDGALDDSDVVTRRLVPLVGPDPDVVLVTADDGAFVDVGDDTLALAPLPQGSADTAVIGSVNDGDAWLFVVGGVTLAVSDAARIEPAGDAAVLALAADDAGVLAAVLDGGALLAGAPAPGVAVLRGDPTALSSALVVSTEASSLPSCAPGHVGFVDSRGVIVRALLETP